MTIRTGSDGPVFLVCRNGRFSQADWDRYLEDLEGFMKTVRQPAAVLTVLRHYARPNPIQRAQLSALRLADSAHKVIRHAYVVDSKEARATLSGLRWMGETPYEERVFDGLTEAIEWLAEKCYIRDPLSLAANVHLKLSIMAPARAT